MRQNRFYLTDRYYAGHSQYSPAIDIKPGLKTKGRCRMFIPDVKGGTGMNILTCRLSAIPVRQTRS